MTNHRRTVLLGSVVLAAWPSVATAQQLTFARDDYASFAGARAIVVGDFDRNGWPDIAQANTTRNSVTILLNHDGTLARASDIPVGTGPFAIAAADFNTDGITDLAVANADSNSISILRGGNDGSFAKVTTLNLGGVRSPRGLQAADLNRDGKTDLVITGYDANAIVLYLGNGANGFTRGTSWFGPLVRPQGIAIADFNRDGRVDSAIAGDGTAGLAVQYGNGSADIFATPTVIGGAQFLNVVAAGDLDGDGWIDVAAASTSNSRVAVWLGTASGLAFNHSYVTGSSPRSIVLADLNDDGMLDVVTGDYASSTISVLLGSRSAPGTFAAARHLPSNSGSRAVVAADFNADGRIDLASGNQNAAFTTILSNTTIFTTAAFSFSRTVLGKPSNTAGGPNGAFTADFNHDGELDIATMAGDATPGVAVLLTGLATVTLPGPQPFFPGSFAVTDANADGNADVMVEQCFNDGLDVVTHLGDGHGGFVPSAHSRSTTRACSAQLGEFNGDAFPDLVLVGYDPSPATWVLRTKLGAGNGTYGTGPVVALDNTYRAIIGVADINRDGRNDAILYAVTSLEIWFGNGAGGFSGSLVVPVILDNGLQGVDVADLNHDGWLDIVAGSDREVAVLLNTGSAFAGAAYLPATSPDGNTLFGSGHGLGVGDVNLDGNADIVTDRGAIFFGRGDGSFGEPALFDLGFNGTGIRIADFNRDGLPDVLTGEEWGSVLVLLNQRNDVNHPPLLDVPDRTFNYQDQFGDDSLSIQAHGSDPDSHALSYLWKDKTGAVVSQTATLSLPFLQPGSYTFTVRASDNRGASVTDSVKVTIAPTKEIVVYAAADEPFGSRWTKVADATAADGERVYNPNAGAPKVETPLASPGSFVTVSFVADPTQTYKLWVRLKADSNYWGNDSIWLQFSGAVDASGQPAYRVGTTSGLPINLEECSGCGVSGWGWEDDGWGAPNRNGVTLRFPQGGQQYLRIQQREDGVSIDQIVLSSETYLTTRPGLAKNDHTILKRTFFPLQ